jgi:hypothetical protein
MNRKVLHPYNVNRVKADTSVEHRRIHYLLEQGYYTQKQIAKMVGVSQMLVCVLDGKNAAERRSRR